TRRTEHAAGHAQRTALTHAARPGGARQNRRLYCRPRPFWLMPIVVGAGMLPDTSWRLACQSAKLISVWADGLYVAPTVTWLRTTPGARMLRYTSEERTGLVPWLNPARQVHWLFACHCTPSLVTDTSRQPKPGPLAAPK